MTKKEVIKKNKTLAEKILLYYESNNSELLNLFNTFSLISNDYIYEFYQEIPDDGFPFDYENMDVRDTIKLVRDFLDGIDKKYLSIFDEALNNGVFELFLLEDDLIERPDEPITYPKPEAVIYVPIQHNITDGSIIVHEFFHYLNDSDDVGVNRYIFTEMISIYFELRYCQYLIAKGISKDAFSKEVCNRLSNVLIASDVLCFTSSVLDIYYNVGEINKKNIDFLNKFRKIYKINKKNLINFYLDSNFSDDMLEFESDISYVVGSLLAFNALNEIEVSDTKMKYINENINQMSMKDVFETFQTSLDEYPKWLDVCKKNLKKAMSDIYGKSYSYSRTNSSREDQT